MKSYMNCGNGLFRIGRLMFTKLPENSIPYKKGSGFRLGWMVGTVITQAGSWVIWWRTY